MRAPALQDRAADTHILSEKAGIGIPVMLH